MNLLRHILLLIITGLAFFNASSQSQLSDLDLDDLSVEDCVFLDSILQVDDDIPEWQRIEYYSSMQAAHEGRGHYMMALYCSDSLLHMYKKRGSKQELADQYRDISMIYDLLGQYSEALEASLKGLELFKELGDKEGEAASYNDIGVLHYYDGDQDQARSYFDKSLVLYQELKDTGGISMYYNNTANTLYEDDQMEKALEMYERAHSFDLILQDSAGMTISMSNIGETYIALGEFDKAEKILLEALVIAEDINDPWSITNPLRGLGSLYQETGEFHKAVRVLEKSINICSDIDALPEQSVNYELLHDIYKTMGNFEKSLHYFELYKELDDSLYDLEKKRSMTELEMKYNLDDKAKELELVKQDQQIKELQHDQEIKSEENKQLFLLIGLLGLGIVVFFAIRGFLQKKKANVQLKEQNEIIISKNEEIKLAYHQIEEKNNEILDSIRYAKRIQSAILPPRARIDDLLKDAFVLYKPKDVVAGDFYWLEEKNGQALFAVADCTGHGVPGAMVSVVCNNGLNRSVREHELTVPGQILDKTRDIVLEEFAKSEDKEVKDGMDIALCTLDLDPTIENRKLLYAGAHNPLWIIRKGSSEIEEHKANKQPIGKYVAQTPFDTIELEVKTGDLIYIFSDGYADQFGGDKGKKMKTANLKKLILSLSGKSMNEQLSRLEDAFDEWKGELEQLDDVCIMGVRIS